MALSFKYWLFLIGIAFILTNVFIDELFNSLWIAIGLIWCLLFILLVCFLIKSTLKISYRKYVWWCVIFLCFSVFNPILEHLKLLFESPPVYIAYLKDDISGVRLTLRKNHNYEIESQAALGPSDKSFGRYKIYGNKVYLLDKPDNEGWLPDTLFINGNKITYRLNNNGTVDTSFANYFEIEKGPSIVSAKEK